MPQLMGSKSSRTNVIFATYHASPASLHRDCRGVWCLTADFSWVCPSYKSNHQVADAQSTSPGIPGEGDRVHRTPYMCVRVCVHVLTDLHELPKQHLRHGNGCDIAVLVRCPLHALPSMTQ